MAIHHHIKVGDRFHFFVVQSTPFRKADKFWYVECLCDCGATKTVKCRDIASGHTKACGCWGKSRPRIGNVTHGLSRSPTWHTYRGMLTRCSNPNQPGYKDYGGRGIKVCERWLERFENFYADMGERPEGATLDRIDVNGDYTPENCRWAALEVQRNNTRQNRRVEFAGENLTVAQWARKTGIAAHTIRVRLALGWGAEETLTVKPVRGRNQFSTD